MYVQSSFKFGAPHEYIRTVCVERTYLNRAEWSDVCLAHTQVTQQKANAAIVGPVTMDNH